MQFLTVMAKLNLNGNSKAFPIFWVIMTNKSEDCYFNALHYFVSKFATFQPTICLTDHEIAMRNALKKVYPGIRSQTCYFHYSEAIIKQAKDKKVINSSSSTHSSPELFYILNLIKYLALLPAHCVKITYEAIKREAKNSFDDLFDNFFNYYEDQWMKKESPEQFSVFDRPQDRTTNIVESYHSQLNALTGKHPESSKFLATLIMLLREGRIDYQAMQSGNYEENSKKPETLERNEEIEELYRKIKDNIKDEKKPINLIEYLKDLKHMKELEEKEKCAVQKMVANVGEMPEENEDKVELKAFAVMTDPNNGEIVLSQLRDIRRKLVVSLDTKFQLRVFNAPKTVLKK
ncbi:uncharacterized protein LOC141533002 isoform X2 [Cotesia typhae]|uniref:uncharacterized protein LOC141533002 isoform X2 n=2 Tax=Cotesia typhae TaxID=2053667 RepID=UPI003D6928DA